MLDDILKTMVVVESGVEAASVQSVRRSASVAAAMADRCAKPKRIGTWQWFMKKLGEDLDLTYYNNVSRGRGAFGTREDDVFRYWLSLRAER